MFPLPLVVVGVNLVYFCPNMVNICSILCFICNWYGCLLVSHTQYATTKTLWSIDCGSEHSEFGSLIFIFNSLSSVAILLMS